MIMTTIACMPIFWTKGKISRIEGGLLIGLYIVYITDKLINRTIPIWQEGFRIVILFIILPCIFILISTQSYNYWKQLKLDFDFLYY